MDPEEALLALKSTRASDRLEAARYFQRYGTSDDRQLLMISLRRETDRWAKHALSRAVARLIRPERPGASEQMDQDLADVLEDLRARAIEEVAKELIHEIEPVLGGIRQDARREIGEEQFEASETRAGLERLGGILDSLGQLSSASGAAREEEFDLAELIEGIIRQDEFKAGRIQSAGPTPRVVLGDPARVDLIVSNGLRNALESTDMAAVDDPVVISWDITDQDVFVSIVDSGVGLATGADKAFDVGTTTKSKAEHHGIGLAIARQAARSLGGEITLGPREEAGARLEFRWPGVPPT